MSEISGGLADIGYTIPVQAWAYWNSETTEGHEWSATTGRAMASNLVAAAKALAENPIPAPPS